MNLAEFHERVCEPPLAQGEEKVRVTAVLLCFDKIACLDSAAPGANSPEHKAVGDLSKAQQMAPQIYLV